MLDPETMRTALGVVSVVVSLMTLALSARVLRLLRAAIRRLKDRGDLERRISARDASAEERGRAAVLPPAPRA